MEKYFKDKQYVFEIFIDEDGRCLILSPKLYYDEEKCVWDIGYPEEIIKFLQDALQAYEVCDSTFELPDDLSDEEVIEILIKCTIATFNQIVFFPEGTIHGGPL